MLYSMKQACQKVGMTYEALKFYCNQGLVPNVKRDKIITECLTNMTSNGLRD